MAASTKIKAKPIAGEDKSMSITYNPMGTENFWVNGAINAMQALAFACDVITYPVHFVVQRPWEKKSASRKVRATPIQVGDKSITYRSPIAARSYHQAFVRENIDTMEKALKFAVKTHGKKECLGTRQILAEEDEVQPSGNVLKKYVMGDYIWRTYEDVEKAASDFGRGLRSIGMEPKKPIVFFSETRAEWLIAANGCFKQNIPIATIYTTLGEEAIAHGINETEVTAIITSHDLLPRFHTILKRCPRVKTLIFFENQLSTNTPSRFEGVQTISYSDVLLKGASADIVSTPPTADDVAIIMYTSGSTGVPKGVLLTHSNFISTLKAFTDNIDISYTDVYLAFLPLAHVFELLVESTCLTVGCQIGYSSPLTMIDSSTKIKKGGKGDATILKPTMMCGVPLILDRIYKGIQDKLAAGGALKRILFNFAYTYKSRWVRRFFDTPLINRAIFQQTKAMLGGRVRFIISGGAPLSPDTQDLVKNCLCAKVLQGYGLTESTASASCMDFGDITTGRIGPPLSGIDFRLVDWEEGNYTVRDKPYPRGELLIGGGNVSNGYYKLPDKSKEDFFTEDGRQWFRTGDIAEVHPDGCFKIIDRKKDLVKLQHGEYVSLGKVESQLKTCPVVDNICVYADSKRNFCVALVVPSPPHLAQITGTKIDDDYEILCKSPETELAVFKELETYGKKCKLEKFEIPKAIRLCSEVWTPETGMVTAAFKLRRKEIQERFQKQIDDMYTSS